MQPSSSLIDLKYSAYTDGKKFLILSLLRDHGLKRSDANFISLGNFEVSWDSFMYCFIPFWSQEDEKIVELVARYGPTKWSVIAKSLPGRIGKQCRER